MGGDSMSFYFWNELLQWAVLGVVLYRVLWHEKTLGSVSECFTVLNTLLQSINDAVRNNDDEQN